MPLTTITGRGLWLQWVPPMKRSPLPWESPNEPLCDGPRNTNHSARRLAKVIRSLYERATGYEYEEEKRIVEYDKDGNVKPVKIEKTKKHVPPDVTAQIFWLKNRQRDRWQDRPQDYVDQTSGNDAEVQIYLPDNGRDD